MRIVAALTAALFCGALLAAAAPAARAGGAPRLDRAERGVIKAINRRRGRHGLRGLRPGPRLSRAADHHSVEMLYGNYFGHASLDGTPMGTRVHRFARARVVGETLAMLGGRRGRHTARRVVRMWMNSPSHRAILLSPRFRRVGVGRRSGRLGSVPACMVTADFSSHR